MTRRMPPHRRWISESPSRRSSGSSRRNPCRTPAGSSSRTRVSRDSCRPRRLMERWMCRRWCQSSRTPARVLPLESTRRRETRPRKGIPWIQRNHLPIYLGFAPWSSIFQHLSPIPGSRQYRLENYHKHLHLRHEYHHLRETPRSPYMPTNKARSMLQSPILYICFHRCPPRRFRRSKVMLPHRGISRLRPRTTSMISTRRRNFCSHNRYHGTRQRGCRRRTAYPHPDRHRISKAHHQPSPRLSPQTFRSFHPSGSTYQPLPSRLKAIGKFGLGPSASRCGRMDQIHCSRPTTPCHHSISTP